MRKYRGWWYGLSLIVLVACANTPPLDLRGVDQSFKLSNVAQRGEAGIGKRVMWGGLIVRSENLATGTELEVLGYPLDKHGQPDMNATAQSRFLIEKTGYLETADYAAGRELTVVGTVREIRPGKVDRFPYPFPVVAAEQLHLWPKSEQRSGSGVNFGFGLGFGF